MSGPPCPGWPVIEWRSGRTARNGWEEGMGGHWSKTLPWAGVAVAALLGTLAGVPGAALAQTAVTPQGVQYFGLVGLAVGQAVRLNIHVGEPDDPGTAPGQCHVKMTILAGDGSVL